MSELDNNFSVEGYNNADADTYTQAAQQTAQLAQQLMANRAAQTAATGCVKPIFNVGKKKAAYEACLAKNSQGSGQAVAPAPAPIPDEPKFFDTTAGKITIGVVVVGVLVGAYFGVKHFTKNK